MTALCATRPAEWWDLGDEGNRLALMLCGICPARRGDRCCAGLPDPSPAGVIRAGRAYADSGMVLALCACGYPYAARGGKPAHRCDRCMARNTPVPERPKGRLMVDESAVELLLSGRRPAVVRDVDRREAQVRLWNAGASNREVAARLGLRLSAVRQARYRHQRRMRAAA